jgi:hypothetical protein
LYDLQLLRSVVNGCKYSSQEKLRLSKAIV